jgi:hypothetical protein
MKRENWIKWDLDSRSGFKMAGFVAEHGAEGYGVFVWLIELLYRAEEHKLPWTAPGEQSTKNANPCKRMQTYATLFKCEQTKLNAYVEHLTSVGLLVFDGEYLCSPRVDEEIGERRAQQLGLSEKRKAAASARWGKPQEVEDANECKPMQVDAKPCQIREDKKREDKKEEKRAQSKYKTFKAEDFPTIGHWSPGQLAALERWVKYRASSGHPKLLESYQTEVEDYREKPQDYARLVERAIAQGWRGLNPNIPLKPDRGNNGSSFEQNMAAREELLNLMRQGNS